MKIKADNTENDENDEITPRPKRPLPRWLLMIIFGVIVIFGAAIFTRTNNSKPTAKPVQKSSQVQRKTSSSINKPQSSSSSIASSSSSSSVKQEDLTKPIQEFFTAYQQYDTSKQNPKARAQAMSQFGTPEAVNDLIPTGIQNQADQTSVRAVYTLTGPIQVIKNSGSDDTYAVTLSYKVQVDNNTNQYTDSYTVTASNGKVTGANQTASVMR